MLTWSILNWIPGTLGWYSWLADLWRLGGTHTHTQIPWLLLCGSWLLWFVVVNVIHLEMVGYGALQTWSDNPHLQLIMPKSVDLLALEVATDTRRQGGKQADLLHHLGDSRDNFILIATPSLVKTLHWICFFGILRRSCSWGYVPHHLWFLTGK